jgi:hypothetical protein
MTGGTALVSGALLLSVACGFGGYKHGLETGRLRADEESRDAVDRANAERDMLRGQLEKAALLYLEAEQNRQSTHREIVRESTKFIDRPVYRNVCIDADGVRTLDRAAGNANARDPGAPSGEAGGAAESTARGG